MPDKICPKCFNEFQPTIEKCVDCQGELLSVDEYKVKVPRSHCKECSSPVNFKDKVCKNCGMKFALIHSSTDISFIGPLAFGFAAWVAVIMVFNNISFTENMNLERLAVISAILVWFVFKLGLKKKIAFKPLEVSWTQLSSEEKKQFVSASER